MQAIKKIVVYTAIGLLSFLVVLATILRYNYGGGDEYEDVSTAPLYNESQLQLVYAHHVPLGNIAVSKDTTHTTRVFFTIHPESRPTHIKLMELVAGTAKPYPSETSQSMFNTVLGVFTDQQNRLWTIDHGNHGLDKIKLLAFNLGTNTKAHEHVFQNPVGKKLSFFNDLSVAPNGKYLVISNVSFFGKNPSLVVYNIETGESKSLLEGHPSVYHENYVPKPPGGKMRFFGIVDLLIGIDGIDFSRDGKYIYYASMGNSALYRIPTSVAFDFNKSNTEIADAVERVADKPLSDGIRTGVDGNVYITDVEHRGIYVVTPDGNGLTLIKDKRIKWADGLSLAGDGTIYLVDSDIPNQMLKSKAHMARHAPYTIYRFKTLSADH